MPKKSQDRVNLIEKNGALKNIFWLLSQMTKEDDQLNFDANGRVCYD